MLLTDPDAASGWRRRNIPHSRHADQNRCPPPWIRRTPGSAGITEGMWDLEVGCGSGDVTLLLSELVGELGEAAGKDHDDDALAAARAVQLALPRPPCFYEAASRTCLNPWAPSTPSCASSTEVSARYHSCSNRLCRATPTRQVDDLSGAGQYADACQPGRFRTASESSRLDPADDHS